MAVTTGNLIENSAAAQAFIDAVQTPAHGTIVFHLTAKHTLTNGTRPDNVVPADSYYAADNPSSGVTADGLGADGTTITASTVYDHLNAATYNITHIRLCRVRWYLNINGTYNLRGTSAIEETVRPTDQRQTVDAVANAGVSAGSLATAASFNDYCSNLYTKWGELRNNRSDFDLYYCHSSCHSNCHSSRGRR